MNIRKFSFYSIYNSCHLNKNNSHEKWHILFSARDYCEQNPCKNGATCSNVEEGYQCTCKPGYSGAQCDQGVVL